MNAVHPPHDRGEPVGAVAKIREDLGINGFYCFGGGRASSTVGGMC